MGSKWLVPSGLGAMFLILMFVVNTNNRQAGEDIVRDNVQAVTRGLFIGLTDDRAIGVQGILFLLGIGLAIAVIVRMIKA